MKTAISLPDSLFEEAESLAQQLGLSLSELCTKALQDYLKKYDREQILLKLNQVYGQQSTEVDSVMAKMQFISLSNDDW